MNERPVADDVAALLAAMAPPPGAGPPVMRPTPTQMRGLPPAIIAIPGHDLLRSSEERYARRLHDDGVAVTVQLDLHLVHAWVEFAPCVPSADRAFARLTSHVNDLIAAASAA